MIVTNEQKQVMLSGILGDGSLIKGAGGAMSFSCQHREYLEYKKELLGDLATEIREVTNNGFKKGVIYTLRCKANDYGKLLFKYSFEDVMRELDGLGLAMWGYDDGALHKKDYFFNLNTHAIDFDTQQNILIPYLNKFNIFPKIYSETKKDGRKFYYLYISLWSGVFEMSKELRKINLDCYSYKTLPRELEDFYFDIKDTEEFKSRCTSYSKTCFLKNKLGLSQKEFMCEYFGTHIIKRKP